MHTFTISEVSTRRKAYILASESKPHERVEDCETENDKIQVSYSILHSQTVFPHLNMLTEGNNSLAVKYNTIIGLSR